MAAFVWGDGGEATTPEDIALRRRLAQALITQGTDTSPVQSWTQGAARVAQAIMGGLDERGIRQDIAAGRASDTANLAALAGGLGGVGATPSASPAATPPTFTRTGGQMALDPTLVQGRQFASTDETGAGIGEYLEGNAKQQGFNNPVFANRMLAFLNDNPAGVGVSSLDRDVQRQSELWQQALAKYGSPEAARKWVAPPGSSNHNRGVAADLSFEDPAARQWAHDNAAKYGLKFPMGNEPWHVEPVETRGGRRVAGAAGADAMVGGAGQDMLGASQGFSTPIGQDVYQPGFNAPMDTSVPLGTVAQVAPAAAQVAPVATPANVPLPLERPASFAAPAPAVAPVPPQVAAAVAAQQTGAVQASPVQALYSGSGLDSGNSIIPASMQQPAPQARVQVASADPAFVPQPATMARAAAPAAPVVPAVAPAVAQAAAPAVAAAPATQAATPPAQPVTPVQRVAQAVSASQPATAPAQAAPGVQAVAQALAPQPQVSAAIKALNNPWASDATKTVAKAIITKSMADPNERIKTQLEIQKMQADLADRPLTRQGLQLGNAKSAFDLENAQRNAPLETALKRKTLEKSDAPTTVQEYEYAQQQGETRPYAQWLMENKKASASQVSIDQKAESKFDQEIASKQAALFSGMAEGAVEGKGDVSRIAQLRGIIGQLPGGFLGNAEVLATQAGIRLGPNASKIEAANAIISSLVPAQRVPGSGTTSDRDLEMFKSAVPRLTNTTQGNSLILDTMQAMAEYKQKQGEIATEVITGAKTRQQAMKELQSLPDPFASFKAAQGKDGSLSPSTGSAAPSGFKILKVE